MNTSDLMGPLSSKVQISVDGAHGLGGWGSVGVEGGWWMVDGWRAEGGGWRVEGEGVGRGGQGGVGVFCFPSSESLRV